MRPMLAATLKGGLETLRYPLYASIKLDGIRALVLDGVVTSRTMKPIPNHYVQRKFGDLEGYDGELIMGDPTAPDCYRNTVTACMTHENPNVVALNFLAFDNYTLALPFSKRYVSLQPAFRHKQIYIEDADMLAHFEEAAVAAGHEGIITRCAEGRYKNGRSTMSEQGMVKIKRFMDDEAVVVGIQEQYHNGNEQTTNNQGYAERTSHRAQMRPMNTLGALVVEWKGKQFNIGTGFTAGERQEIWNMGRANAGRVCKFKYLPIGMKDLPRHPVFLGWRLE